MKTKEVVPFAEANIERKKMTFTDGSGYKLSGNRSVQVCRAEGMPGKVGVFIRRPTDDGKISELAFGLNEDSAQALCLAICDVLSVPGADRLCRFLEEYQRARPKSNRDKAR